MTLTHNKKQKIRKMVFHIVEHTLISTELQDKKESKKGAH